MPLLAFFVLADAAETAGQVLANLVVIAGFVFAIIGYRRRRARGQRAVGWLIASIILGLLVLGAIVSASQGG